MQGGRPVSGAPRMTQAMPHALLAPETLTNLATVEKSGVVIGRFGANDSRHELE